MCVTVLPAPHAGPVSVKVRKGHQAPWFWIQVTGSRSVDAGNPNPGPQEEQPGLLSTKPALQPLNPFIFRYF